MSQSPAQERSMPSTPHSVEDDYRGVHHLIQHNAEIEYPPGTDTGTHFYRESQRYGSPESNHWHPDQYLHGSQLDSYRRQIEARESEYGWQQDVGLFHSQPYQDPYTYESFAIPDKALKNGYHHKEPLERHRIPRQKDEAPRRKKKESKPKTETENKLEKALKNRPLSVATANSSKPVKDMEAYVKRGRAERLEEIVKKKGKVPRPMNSFMLYRSAYADRTKEWCDQFNHQVVSSLCGASWKHETQEIKTLYTNLANEERINHQLANPGYKFSPSKSTTTPRKRKGADLDSERDSTEPDPADREWTPSGVSRSKERQIIERYDRGMGSSPQAIGDAKYNNMLSRSAFHSSPPSRCVPARVPLSNTENLDDRGQYCAPTIRTSANVQGPHHVIDVELHKVPGPRGYMGAPSGLPGANHDDLLNFDDPLLRSYSQSFSSLDPSLTGFDNPYSEGNFTDQGFDDFNADLVEQSKHELNGSNPKMEDDTADGMWGSLNAANDEAFKTWVNESNEH